MMASGGLDWGSVPSWFGGASFLIALFLLGQGQYDRRKDAEDRRREQATRVALYSITEDRKPSEVFRSGGTERLTWDVPTLHNNSDFPVYDVQFWVALPNTEGTPGLARRNHSSELIKAIGGPARIVLPGDKASLRTKDPRWRNRFVDVTFYDKAGVYWHRNPSGDLEEVKVAPGESWTPGDASKLPKDNKDKYQPGYKHRA